MPSEGELRYSPKQLGQHYSPNWWLVVDCDPSIGEYYRHLYHLARNRCVHLVRPAWKEHISVVRDEEPRDRDFWEIYTGHTVKFWYKPEPETDGSYYWLDVECPALSIIREELGLHPRPEYPFHITIGHTEEAAASARAARKIKNKHGFRECSVCGEWHPEKVLVCRSCMAAAWE